MNQVQYTIRFLKKILSGKDPLLVLQNKEQWDAQFARGSWDRLTHEQPNTEHIARVLLEHVRDNTKIHILDVGCGNGGLARLLAPHSNQLTYVGIDLSDTAIERARTEFPEGTFIATDAAFPPKDLGVFDFIVFNEVFFYINPKEVIPRYAPHTQTNTTTIISVVRSWRTLFIAQRIRARIHVASKKSIYSKKGTRHIWDIWIGTMKQPLS